MGKSEQPVYLVEGLRTQIGKPYKSLKNFKAVQLAAGVMDCLIRQVSLDPEKIDQVYLGNTLSAGLGQNFAREAVAMAQFPIQIPACVVDNVCGSSLEALVVGCDSIQSGRNHGVVCVGAESITFAPFLVDKEKVETVKEEDCVDSLRQDGLFCQITQKLMGQLAENLAKKHKISRERQDAFALASHQKALEATQKGLLEREIVAIEKGGKTELIKDDCIRKNISLERLMDLPPAFEEGGTVTAGNSSRICDGAAAVLLASKEFVEENHLHPRAQILQAVTVAREPCDTYEGGVEAIRLCLKKAGLEIGDVDLFEICEAFASQMIYTQDALKIASSKINIFGGDIAIGHPMGASGLRALITLMNALTFQKKTIGVACVSFGGGGAIAVLIKCT